MATWSIHLQDLLTLAQSIREMNPLLQPLLAEDPEARFEAIDNLADQFELGRVPGKAYVEVIGELIKMAAKATEPDWQEALLNTLNHAMIRFQGDAKQFDWKPLLAAMKRMETGPLAEILPILTMTGQPNVRDLLVPYLQHKEERVREAAGFAWDELDMSDLM